MDISILYLFFLKTIFLTCAGNYLHESTLYQEKCIRHDSIPCLSAMIPLGPVQLEFSISFIIYSPIKLCLTEVKINDTD